MAETVEAGRYAVIVKREDGKEEVADIKLMSGGVEPEVYNNAKDTGNYTLEEVPGGVMIGMVRGGEGDAIGGFGFEEPGGKGDRLGPGMTRVPSTENTIVSLKTEGKTRGLEQPTEEINTVNAASDDSPAAPRAHSGASRRSAKS